MAEGLLGGVGGAEKDNDGPERGSEAPAGAEAFAAAIAAIASRQDPGVARKTETFLDKQSRLLDIQAHHLEDEHELRISQMRHQRLSLRLRIAFQVLAALIASVVGLGLAWMLHDAFTSHNVVVEPFDSPPAAVARGLTANVVAGQFLNELTRMQAATGTGPRRAVTSAWSGEIKLAVPETGLSLGEISRLLKARFGHDLHVEGALVQSDDGALALTIRGDGLLPKTFSGAIGDLDGLTTKAAEYVYSESLPASYVYYLTNVSRFNEAIAFARARFPGANAWLRGELLNSWANALAMVGGTRDELISLYRAALRFNPQAWAEYNNISGIQMATGDEQGAWRTQQDLRRAASGRPEQEWQLMSLAWYQLTYDETTVVSLLEADAASNEAGGSYVDPIMERLWVATAEAYMHDSSAAGLTLLTIKPDETNLADVAMTHFVRGQLAIESGNMELAATEMAAYGKAYADPVASLQVIFGGGNCWTALTEENAGHPDKADAALKTGGTFVDCYRFRGDILNHRGNWEAAQKAYADAVALAPDLPAAYYSWGVALAQHGDLDAAAAKLKDAHQKGPRWADPLKAWGDVLVKQGKTGDALVKYDEALKYAPNWKQLNQAHDAVAKQKS
jgi:tetratricopeptide (TPR) repeat protein